MVAIGSTHTYFQMHLLFHFHFPFQDHIVMNCEFLKEDSCFWDTSSGVRMKLWCWSWYFIRVAVAATRQLPTQISQPVGHRSPQSAHIHTSIVQRHAGYINFLCSKLWFASSFDRSSLRFAICVHHIQIFYSALWLSQQVVRITAGPPYGKYSQAIP